MYYRRAIAGIIGPPLAAASISRQDPGIIRRMIPPLNIYNLDEVGLAYEEVSSITLADIGAKTV